MGRRVRASRLQRPVRPSARSASDLGVGIAIGIGIDSRRAICGHPLVDLSSTADVSFFMADGSSRASIPIPIPNPTPTQSRRTT
jgi:hypothetical protein